MVAASATDIQPNGHTNGTAPKINGINGTKDSKSNTKLSKNQLRRAKKKEKKKEPVGSGASNGAENEDDEEMSGAGASSYTKPAEEIAREYAVSEDQLPDGLVEVFKKFALPPESDSKVRDGVSKKGEIIYSDDEMESAHSSSDEKDGEEEKKPLSRKKARKLNRLTVAQLKQLVPKPELVEWTDPAAPDPRLLLTLKGHRNTVPIPIHWSAKRDYLQGKRGIEKPPFQLPSYIADTGIATMRDAVKEKEAGMSLKAKTRERVQPKMGKIDIDYQKLHDAFFKYMTKPLVTGFGEVYYEGKEFETQLREKKPGDLSPELVEALSIPPLAPPPWLISMQRFGPPPSYPTLRIPGLNAPIPEGAQWGFHPGGWGKPPLDEYNRPLYGDVFGVLPKMSGDLGMGEPVVKDLWGELEPEENEEEESEEEEEESDNEDTESVTSSAAPTDGLQTPSGLATPSGMASVVSTIAGGLETPDFLELRKTTRTKEVEEEDRGPRSLYTVLEEKQTNIRGMMGGDRGYDVSNVVTGLQVLGEDGRDPSTRGTKRKAGGVDIALDASELEGLNDEELKKRYEAARKAGGGGVHVPGAGGEDMSDMVAKEMAGRMKKAKIDKERRDSGRREKEYKF